MLAAVAALRAAGYTQRRTAELLGVSHQRIAQLEQTEPACEATDPDRCPHTLTTGPWTGHQCCRPTHTDTRHA